MKVKGLLFILLLLIAAPAAFSQDEQLLCLNYQCFVAESPVETMILNESTTPSPGINPDFAEYPEPQEDYYQNIGIDDDIYQESKYYEITNRELSFFRKRFLNVPTRDMIWATAPEYESTRPNIILEYFNKPDCPPLNFNWEETEDLPED